MIILKEPILHFQHKEIKGETRDTKLFINSNTLSIKFTNPCVAL